MNIKEVKAYRNAERFPAVDLNDEITDWAIATIDTLTKDRDEWKDSCIDANKRFQRAEAKVKVLREAMIYQADIHGCGLDCTCGQDDCASCCTIKALAGTEKEKIK